LPKRLDPRREASGAARSSSSELAARAQFNRSESSAGQRTMKAAATATAFAFLTRTAFATAVNAKHLAADSPIAVSLFAHDRRQHHFRTDAALFRSVAHFGDTRCPCIGFDNIDGETIVTHDDGVQSTYPADLGARCEAWDDGRHPSCKEGKEPGLGNGWCAQSWCYVDACNCDLPVLPMLSEYVPDARYRGRPVFYSYATCGGKNLWADEIPQVGTAGCRCIGFDNIPGTTDITLMIDGESQTVSYPAEIGGTCKAWDEGVHPECRKGKDSPKWCSKRWCYVDPCSCNLDQPPKVTLYLPEATFTGKSLYYSYATCGDEDFFTKKYNLEACVNQDNEEDCLKLKVREGGNKCAWTGAKCLGWEIVEHPLCKKVVQTAQPEKSSARGFGLSLATVLVAGRMLFF